MHDSRYDMTMKVQHNTLALSKDHDAECVTFNMILSKFEQACRQDGF